MNFATLRILIGCLVVFFVGCAAESNVDKNGAEFGISREDKSVGENEKIGSVTVTIRYPDGSIESSDVNIDSDDTVADVLRRLSDLVVVMQGSGSMTFVAGIGDFTTAGGEGWSYRVNGQWADRSVGVYNVSPGDQIEWTYGNFDLSDQE